MDLSTIPATFDQNISLAEVATALGQEIEAEVSVSEDGLSLIIDGGLGPTLDLRMSVWWEVSRPFTVSGWATWLALDIDDLDAIDLDEDLDDLD